MAVDRPFFFPVKVYIEDTDAGGIVYHANYIKFMERSRTEFLTHLGFDKPATLENGLLLVVHSMKIEFLAAARLGDELLTTTQITKLARSYVVFEQKVMLGDLILCRADVKIACVKKETMKPTLMPSVLQQRLSGQVSSVRI